MPHDPRQLEILRESFERVWPANQRVADLFNVRDIMIGASRQVWS